MADAPEERKSLRIRVLDDNFTKLPSEGVNSSNDTPKPTMSTEYASNTARRGDVKSGTVRQGWFPEDWINASEIGSITRLGTNSSKTLSGNFPSKIGGANKLFSGRVGGDTGAGSESFARSGSSITIAGSGDLVWGVGVTANNKTRLNERACYDCAVGMLMSFDTADTDYSGSNTMKWNDIYLLYMNKNDTSKTYYSPLVQNGQFANQDEDRTRKSDTTPIGKRIDSSDKDDKWTNLPHIGGMFAAYIPQTDIDILKGGDYRCTGIVWKVNFGGYQTMHWYDHKFVFVDHQENHKRARSLKIIQVPQSFVDTFRINNLEIGRAPEHSSTYT